MARAFAQLQYKRDWNVEKTAVDLDGLGTTTWLCEHLCMTLGRFNFVLCT